MRRICIYLTYDRQKTVDRYIGYMLKELKSCADCLVVVCNGTEVVRGMEILEEYADRIFYRENVGFDAGGFKDALCSLVGWDKVLQYDELVLANDSMFGPFKPMQDIFAEMERRRVDFWGLIKRGEGRYGRIGCIPEHIQSFFFLVGSRMLHCSQFRDYWESMPYYHTLHETVIGHEINFTGYFAGLGYTFDALADTGVNDSADADNNYTQYSHIAFELIKKRNFPFLKRQQIADNTLNRQTQENLRQAIEYIGDETGYDVDLIWENIIRVFDMSDLQRSLHLQHIVPSSDGGEAVPENVLVAVFVSYKESVEYVLEYIQSLRDVCHIKIFSESGECLEDYRKMGFACGKFESGGLVELLSGFGGYDYVCVLQDADMTSDREPSCTGKSYFYSIWENLAKDSGHVARICHLFGKEPRLGFLAPPQPNFAEYFGGYGKEWDGKYEAVRSIAEAARIVCQVSAWKPPYRVTSNFWIRGCILKGLKGLECMDSSILPYMWSYLAQGAGYYSGVVESAEYASMNEVNLQYYLQQTASQVRRGYGDFGTFAEMQEKLLINAIQGFCGKYSRILVYGIGDVFQKYRNLLSGVEAFVVTDGQPKPEELGGVPVKYLSEITEWENCGVVLCLDRRNQTQVVPLLEKQGIVNYLCI